MLLSLSEEKVKFLLVGAHAMAAYGYPRSTGDIDFWVKPSPNNAVRVFSALKKFGAPITNISQTDFETPGIVFQIGVAPRRIDILTAIDGVEFDDAFEQRKDIQIDGLTVPVISLLDLIKNKESTSRVKDKVDAQNLTALSELKDPAGKK